MDTWALPVCASCRFAVQAPDPDPDASSPELLGYVRDLVHTLGRVPPAETPAGDLLETATAEQLPALMELFACRPESWAFKEHFGGWLEALIACGALPDGAYRTGRGTRCLARDGHQCASLGERLIDDLLYAEGIPHEREPVYQGSRMRADFLIGGTYVEYLGLAGRADYDQRTDHKRAWCAERAIPLLLITPPELSDVQTLRERLVSLVGVHDRLPAPHLDGPAPGPHHTVPLPLRQAAREQRAAARRTRMLAAGAVEITGAQYIALTRWGEWSKDFRRSPIFELHAREWRNFQGDGGGGYVWLDEQRRPHRDDGPAVERADGQHEYWRHGKLHRDEDLPAVWHPSGRREWYRDGERHRQPGPAVIYSGRREEFWVSGQRKWADDAAVQRTDENIVDGVPVEDRSA